MDVVREYDAKIDSKQRFLLRTPRYKNYHVKEFDDGQVVLVRPEQLRFAGTGLSGVVTERRYTGAAAFFQVTIETGERLEVQAAPDGARIGDRVSLGAERVLRFPEPGR